MMNQKSYIELAREKVKAGSFYLSHHTRLERGYEEISVDDIVSIPTPFTRRK
jgi:hypothetical protein